MRVSGVSAMHCIAGGHGLVAGQHELERAHGVGIGGADFLSEQQIFLPPYTFFSDWHKRFDAPGTSTSADGSADKFHSRIHYFLP